MMNDRRQSLPTTRRAALMTLGTAPAALALLGTATIDASAEPSMCKKLHTLPPFEPTIADRLQYFREREAYMRSLEPAHEAADNANIASDTPEIAAAWLDIDSRYCAAISVRNDAFIALMVHPCDLADHRSRAEAVATNFLTVTDAFSPWEHARLAYGMAGVPMPKTGMGWSYSVERYVHDLEAAGVHIMCADGWTYHGRIDMAPLAYSDARRRAHDAGLSDAAVALYIEVRQAHA